VAWSTTPTLDTDYGAGWWINRRTMTPPAGQPLPDMPLMPDVPPDTFYGLGNLGQYLVVVPSAQLVVVRLGRSHTPDFDIQGMNRLLAGLLKTLR
jgi:CubicO group peptidase (beta-lactamase class C family)